MNDIWTNNDKSAATIPAAILPTVNAVERLISWEAVSINDLPVIKMGFLEQDKRGELIAVAKMRPGEGEWTPEDILRLDQAIAKIVARNLGDNT